MLRSILTAVVFLTPSIMWGNLLTNPGFETEDFTG